MNFDHTAFAVFNEPELAGRMSAIQERIQPTFQYFGDILAKHLQQLLNQEQEVYVHIAKHLRRTTYPSESTWVAIGGDKRGYKKYPHFQIGINEQYVFFALSLIDNPIHEKSIAKFWQENTQNFEQLPKDYVVIPDHTQLGYLQSNEINWKHLLMRLETVKKAEFMVGQVFRKGDKRLENTELLTHSLIMALEALVPFYKEAMSFYLE